MTQRSIALFCGDCVILSKGVAVLFVKYHYKRTVKGARPYEFVHHPYDYVSS